jgi:hypothetical protein
MLLFVRFYSPIHASLKASYIIIYCYSIINYKYFKIFIDKNLCEQIKSCRPSPALLHSIRIPGIYRLNTLELRTDFVLLDIAMNHCLEITHGDNYGTNTCYC